jgi:phage tail sheath protein FI
MPDFKTPGVYVKEINTFPNAVVAVDTAVPAFIGCTAIAMRGDASLLNKPTRISSLVEYQMLFGEGPAIMWSYGASSKWTVVPHSQFYFYSAIRLFFENGGGPCYIVSVDSFDAVAKAGGMAAFDGAAKVGQALDALKNEQEPTMVVVPDAVLMDIDQWQAVCQQVLDHCNAMQTCIAIFDVPHGDQARNHDPVSDVISGQDGFRARIGRPAGEGLSYGAAYYPWLNTCLMDAAQINFTLLEDDSRARLAAELSAEALAMQAPVPGALRVAITQLATPGTSGADVLAAHQVLRATSPLYQRVMGELLQQINVVPPSGAIAGVYARVDNERGVSNAPANIGIVAAVSPVVPITNQDQDDLNAPLDGLAVNAIRTFPGRGLVIWGARTLDGNSQDWRYINVRRTVIMLEQSIKLAARAYCFEPNTAVTWTAVRSMVSDFLVTCWKQGMLAGARPQDAFNVSIGLGNTMTADDVLAGWMKFSVMVALVRPAEFIVLTFQQQMNNA